MDNSTIIAYHREDDRDDGCRSLNRENCASSRDNDIDFKSDKLSRDLSVALIASLGPAILDADSAPFDPAEFARSPLKSGDPLAPR